MKLEMKLGDAVVVKSAEYWLCLGQPAQALLELQKLPEEARNHPWSVIVLRKAFQAARGAGGWRVAALAA